MPILWLDTCADVCRIAVGTGDSLLSSLQVRHNQQLSTRLFSWIDTCLNEACITREDLHAIGVNRGPGSYTGVRVGVVTARMLAWSGGLPLVGLSALDVLCSMHTGSAPVLAVLPARRGEVYAQAYSGREVVMPAGVCSPEDLMTRLPGALRPPVVIGQAPDGFVLPWPVTTWIDVDGPAEAVAIRLCAELVSAGRVDDPLGLQPLYLKPPAISKPREPYTPPQCIR